MSTHGHLKGSTSKKQQRTMVEVEDDEILVAKDVTASQSTLPPPSSMHALISTMYEKMQIMLERLGTIDIEMYQLNKKIGRMSRKAFKIKDLIPSMLMLMSL